MSLRDVEAGYGRRVILAEVSLDVRRGAVTALIGENGSGKTTLLRVMLGLLPPRRGALGFAAGRPPRTGYVPQVDVSEVRFPVTAHEVVMMGLTPFRPLLGRLPAADHDAARAALESMHVADLDGRMFRDLSGGQRQRVLLARGLVADPELLVLDEPVRGLDFPSQAALVERIAELARQRGIAVVVATHSLDLVANFADDVALVRDGRVAAGRAADVMTSARLTEFHGRPVVVGEVDGQRVVVPGRPRGAGPERAP